MTDAVQRAADEAAAAVSLGLDPTVPARIALGHVGEAIRGLAEAVDATKPALPELIEALPPAVLAAVGAPGLKTLHERCSAEESTGRDAAELGRALLVVAEELRSPRPGSARRTRQRRTLAAAAAATLVVAAVAWASLSDVRSGTPAGAGRWHAAYYSGRAFKGPVVQERVADLSFDWRNGPPHESVSRDNFTAKFTTCLRVDAESELAFSLIADDRARLLIDDEVVVGATHNAGKPEAGRYIATPGMHTLVVEYAERRKAASLHLVASVDGGRPAPLPPTLLAYPTAALTDDPCR